MKNKKRANYLPEKKRKKYNKEIKEGKLFKDNQNPKLGINSNSYIVISPFTNKITYNPFL